jgi:hypothetical protein
MMLTLNGLITDKPFRYTRFHGIIDAELFGRCQEDAQRFPYYKIEKTRTSNPNRVWLNQQSGYLSSIAHEFNRDDVQCQIGLEMGSIFRGCRTRVELCMDSVGSWLEPHKDDAAKVMTMQLYLSGHGNSTKLGSTETWVRENDAWAFDNTDQPIHSLEPLKYNRASIIINYVTDDWRDKSVLV